MRHLGLLFLAALPLAASAQMIDVAPGARVRFNAPGQTAGRVTGTVISRTGDSLVVATPAMVQYRLAFASMKELAVSQGKSGQVGAKKGFLWGAGVTLPFSLAVAVSAKPTTYRGHTEQPPRVAIVVMTAAVYGGIGALIGAAIGGERWAKHQLPGAGTVRPAIGFAPTGGVRAGARFQLR